MWEEYRDTQIDRRTERQIQMEDRLQIIVR